MATPTPTPPAGGTTPSHPLLTELVQTVKKYAGFDLDLNFFISAGNPEIDALAKKHAEVTDKKLKADSFFRSSIAERGLGMLAAALENMGDRYTGVLKALFKKGADYLESFGTYFYGHSLKEGAKKHGDDEMVKLRMKHYDAFFERSIQLLMGAKASQLPELRKYLAEEARIVHELMDLTVNGPKKPEEPKVPFGERVDRFNEIMEQELGPAVKHIQRKVDAMNARTRALQAQQRQAAATRQPSKMDSCLRKLSRVLFGFPKPTT